MEPDKMATSYWGHANKAWLSTEAQPRGDASAAPDNPHWDVRKCSKWLNDALPHATSWFDEAPKALHTPRNDTRGCREPLQDGQQLGGTQLHATSQICKKPSTTMVGSARRRQMELFLSEDDDEVLEDIIKPLSQRLQDSGPAPGYTPEVWGIFMRYLSVPAVYEGEGTLIEKLWRCRPPSEHDAKEWKSFLDTIDRVVQAVTKSATETFEGPKPSTKDRGQTDMFVVGRREPAGKVTPLQPLTIFPSCPVETYGERMFMPQNTTQHTIR